MDLPIVGRKKCPMCGHQMLVLGPDGRNAEVSKGVVAICNNCCEPLIGEDNGTFRPFFLGEFLNLAEVNRCELIIEVTKAKLRKTMQKGLSQQN